MLRFLPDSWFEGLVRPLLMADPVAGLYLEDAAPDWRFAVLFPVMALALLLRRRQLPIGLPQVVAIVGLGTTFYLWTFVSGNGRYYTWGLLLAAPLLVLACWMLPLARRLRWALIVGVLGVQATVMHLSYAPNLWAGVRTGDTALPLQASPLRESPAVFLTVSSLSYSILVPLFHPDSRWANIAGQYNISPGMPEWTRLQAVLRSPLPRYLVTPVRPQDHDPQGQPLAPTLHILDETLLHHGLGLAAGGCRTLRSALSGPGRIETEAERGKRGFWVCALEARTPRQRADGGTASPEPMPEKAAEQAALGAVESRCPRFFPPGGGKGSLVAGAHVRHYAATDVRLWIHPPDVVLFQYYRAMNPTVLGTVESVRAGKFQLPCDKLPGRYIPFWERD